MIEALVGTALGLLAPYLIKGGEEFAKEAGKGTAQFAGRLLKTLKDKLAEDPEATDALTKFEQKPDRYQGPMGDILKEKLQADPGFAAEIDRLLKELRLQGGATTIYVGTLTQTTKTIHGDNIKTVVSAGGDVNVNASPASAWRRRE